VEHSGEDLRAVTQLGEFMREAVLLMPDEATAKTYAKLKSFLADKGKLIPENDLWIAATAKSHDLTLYCDDAHFDELKGQMDIRQVSR
jgi:tRNA(fMet)-specific endonuclease VapC